MRAQNSQTITLKSLELLNKSLLFITNICPWFCSRITWIRIYIFTSINIPVYFIFQIAFIQVNKSWIQIVFFFTKLCREYERRVENKSYYSYSDSRRRFSIARHNFFLYPICIFVNICDELRRTLVIRCIINNIECNVNVFLHRTVVFLYSQYFSIYLSFAEILGHIFALSRLKTVILFVNSALGSALMKIFHSFSDSSFQHSLTVGN